MPYLSREGQRFEYLKYRAVGFTTKESLQLAGVSQKYDTQILYRWRREDETFAELDGEKLPLLKDYVSRQFIFTKFTRNLLLALERDQEVLMMARHGEDLSARDWEYLLKIRPLYGIEKVKSMMEVLQPGQTENKADFTRMILQLKDTGTITFETGKVESG